MKRNEATKGISAESRKFAEQLYIKYGKIMNMVDIMNLVCEAMATYSNDLRIEEEMNRIEEENKNEGMETIFARSGNGNDWIMQKLSSISGR